MAFERLSRFPDNPKPSSRRISFFQIVWPVYSMMPSLSHRLRGQITKGGNKAVSSIPSISILSASTRLMPWLNIILAKGFISTSIDVPAKPDKWPIWASTHITLPHRHGDNIQSVAKTKGSAVIVLLNLFASIFNFKWENILGLASIHLRA